MSLGQIVKAVLRSQWEDQAGVNVVHYFQTGGTGSLIDSAVLKEIADRVSAGLGLAIRETMSGLATYEGCTVYYPFRGNQGPLQIAYFSNLQNGPGGSGSDNIAPTQVSGLVSKRTAYTGRNGRGRLYVPFPPFSALTADDDLVGAAYATALADVGAEVASVLSFSAAGETWVFTPCLVKADGPLIQTARPVVQGVPRPGWATQRRRSYYGRRNVPFSP